MGGIFSSPSSNVKPDDTLKFDENKKPFAQTAVPLVLCYSYIGTDYHGLQQNPEQKTIEEDLLHVLIDSKLINSDVIFALNRIRWSQASRTDAGVHAAAQVLTFDAQFSNGLKVSQVLPLIQSKLPKNSPICFWSVITVGRQFNAQKYAEFRQYNYLMPLYALNNYSISEINQKILPFFVGEKNYHNYTRKVSYNNPSALRKITDFSISDPFDVNGEKYVLWYIRGNSFMINQIRKMLATVLSIAHNVLTIDQLKDTFTETKWALPRLPGEGLFLNKVEYPGFVKSAGKRKEFSANGKNVEFDHVRGDIEKWKTKVLYPHIAKLVSKKDIFNLWIKDVLLNFPPHLIADEPKYHREK